LANEHDALGIGVELAIEPIVPIATTSGAVLLDPMASHFYASCRDQRRSGKAPAIEDVQAKLDLLPAPFIKRDFLERAPRGEDLLDPARAHITNLRLRRVVSGRRSLILLADRPRCCDKEPRMLRKTTIPIIVSILYDV
jgi:hypothetical protein